MRYDDLIQIGSDCLRLRPVRHVALRVLIDRGSHEDFRTPHGRMVRTFLPGADLLTSLLDAAGALCETLEPELREDRSPDIDGFRRRRRMVLSVAEPLRAGDRAALAKILHGWEADNSRGTRIAPYGAPTPFPLEAASAS